MKTTALILALALVFHQADVESSQIFKSAYAQDICGGQETFNDWYFAVADTDGRKINFGPYRCKNICREARNNETRKVKWLVVGACETGNIPSNIALSILRPKWKSNEKKLREMGIEYKALDERIPGELARWEELNKEAAAAVREFDRKMPEFEKIGTALEARKAGLNEEYENYYAACNRALEDSQEVANCNARFDRYTVAHATLDEAYSRLDFEVLTLNNRVNRALGESKKLGEQIQAMEERKNYLFDEGIQAHASLIQLAPEIQGFLRGQVRPYVDSKILKEIGNLREVCRPFEYVNPFDYEDCDTYYKAGQGPYVETILAGENQ